MQYFLGFQLVDLQLNKEYKVSFKRMKKGCQWQPLLVFRKKLFTGLVFHFFFDHVIELVDFWQYKNTCPAVCSPSLGCVITG